MNTKDEKLNFICLGNFFYLEAVISDHPIFFKIIVDSGEKTI